jgi:predicted transcriptional regulator of viral defense system
MMASQDATAPQAVSAFADRLQARGTYTFSKADVRDVLPKSEIAIDNALRRLKKRGRIVTPRRGFYVIVPTEYRSAGSPPPSWFIDDLMRSLGQPYYVGLLSAAAIHGASHQQPMVFQVVTDRPTRQGAAGRSHITFHMSRDVGRTPLSRVQTETGTMAVSTPEATAFDLVRFPADGDRHHGRVHARGDGV